MSDVLKQYNRAHTRERKADKLILMVVVSACIFGFGFIMGEAQSECGRIRAQRDVAEASVAIAQDCATQVAIAQAAVRRANETFELLGAPTTTRRVKQ